MLEISCTLKSGFSKLDYSFPSSYKLNTDGIYLSSRADNIVMQDGNVFKESNMCCLWEIEL